MENNTVISEKIQLIINTIQSIEIKADYDTMNKLLGCLQLLNALKNDSKDWVIPAPKNSIESDTSEEIETDK